MIIPHEHVSRKTTRYVRASSLSMDLNVVVRLVSNGIEIYRRLASFRLWHEIVAQLIRMLSPVLMLDAGYGSF